MGTQTALDSDDLGCIQYVLDNSTKIRNPMVWKLFREKIVKDGAVQYTPDQNEEEDYSSFALSAILSTWSNNKNNTLKDLVNILDECKLSEEADELREMFDLEPKALPDERILRNKANKDVISKFVAENIDGLSCCTEKTALQNSLVKNGNISHWDLQESREHDDDEEDASFYLYKILVSNPQYLNEFVAALEELDQKKAGWILRKVYHKLPNLDTEMLVEQKSDYTEDVLFELLEQYIDEMNKNGAIKIIDIEKVQQTLGGHRQTYPGLKDVSVKSFHQIVF